MNKPLLCRIGFHRWLYNVAVKEITQPKCGPFDPRSDAARTRRRRIDVCSRCGMERKDEKDLGGYL